MKYQFIYWKNEEQKEGTEKEKIISAKSLKKACAKFVKKTKNFALIDYEVKVEMEDEDKIQDISDVKIIQQFLK